MIQAAPGNRGGFLLERTIAKEYRRSGGMLGTGGILLPWQ